jgi:hypothetical protein
MSASLYMSPFGQTVHPSLGHVSYVVQEVSDNPDTQVEQVTSLMKRYALEDSQTPQLQADVSQAMQSADALGDTFEYLKRDGGRGMRFVRDEITASPFAGFETCAPGGWRPFVEAIIRPELLAQVADPHGDCDCFCGYGAAHLICRGVKCSYATVAADANEPGVYSHVYLVAYPKDGPYAGQRVPMDLSHGPYVGWEAANQFGKFREWPVTGSNSVVKWLLAFGVGYFGYRAIRRTN